MLQDFGSAVQPFLEAGWRNSLTQAAVKLLAPGIPDIYQGSEIGDFSLVDPDNRPLVEAGALGTALNQAESVRGKPWLIRTLLRLRREKPRLFTDGAYHPLSTTGSRADHAFAFARRLGDDAVILVAARQTLAIPFGSAADLADFWRDTALELPRELASVGMRDVLNKRGHGAQGSHPIKDILSDLHLAALVIP